MSTFKICYFAKHKISNKPFDKNNPYQNAYIEANSRDEAISKLNEEFPMLDINVKSIEKT